MGWMARSSGKALAFSMKETDTAIVAFPSPLPWTQMSGLKLQLQPGGIKPTRKGREDGQKEIRSLRAWLSCCFHPKSQSSRHSKIIIHPDHLHDYSWDMLVNAAESIPNIHFNRCITLRATTYGSWYCQYDECPRTLTTIFNFLFVSLYIIHIFSRI